MEISYDDVLKLIKFSDYENIKNYGEFIGKAIESEWNKFYNDNNHDDCIVDEKAEEYRLFSYRMTAMQLCCFIEVWEQDLFNFLYDIANKDSNSELITKLTGSYHDKEYLDNNYNKLKIAYEYLYGETISSTSNIEDIREIINAIKHGTGKSFETIKEKFGNAILADSNFSIEHKNGLIERFKQVRYDNNTLTSIVLNLDGKIEDTYNTIIAFWNKTYELEKNRRTVNV